MCAFPIVFFLLLYFDFEEAFPQYPGDFVSFLFWGCLYKLLQVLSRRLTEVIGSLVPKTHFAFTKGRYWWMVCSSSIASMILLKDWIKKRYDSKGQFRKGSRFVRLKFP